ncbi:nucleotidyltransferase domain-containing protein [Paenibacillus sp. 1011MAR3C5]|uniref:nucleotidyltransferase domain-containing protein n=1 Tax=Paenibacillus sp. 1011MAR3C5 TaxID=1675787 RepID=UPI000E6B92E1|nr:nucleotidyltransferase domain-containing protein [Paenibacillus sp. 1011MAR3C5]RJE86893.1 nucleotidyltransferase domain-containing protein [Paenibacillus sp. 1011MAR3C5]
MREHINVAQRIEEIIPVLQGMLTGRYAIALGGSYAKGYMDEHSDLDFYVYTDGVKPLEERRSILSAIADADQSCHIDEHIEGTLWGGCADFYYSGMKVETSVKSIAVYEQAIRECLDGKIFVEPTFWTLSGYYNYICLSEVSFVQPLIDEVGLLTNWKGHVSVYPEKLKKAIIQQFWWKSTFWLDNFHYLSAIERGDFVYASGIAQQTFHSLLQVLLAANEVYFKGDKKIGKQLSELAFCPEPLIHELDFLLGAHQDRMLLKRQRQLLLEITNAVRGYMTDHNWI